MGSADERGAAGTGLQSFQGVANLDFLAEPAALLLNLKPDANGVVNVPRSELGAHSLVQVVAVSPVATVARVISLPDVAASPRDLRLISTLDPRKHYAERREVSFLQADENLVFEDASAAQFEVYDTIGKALRLLATVSGNATLAEFGFIADWPRLSREEKLAKYSKYSCHELDFFLFKKDPGFFREVVRPYLAQKLERTFLDDWLLERDVLPYVDPWAFARLNAAERILLAQRVEGERPRVEQHVRDLLELIPEDVERRERLFEAALRGRALETAAGLGGDKLGERLAAVEAKPAAMAAKGRRAPPEEARAAAAPAPEPTSESAAEAPALAAGEDRKETKKNDAFFRKDAALRRSVRQLYRSVEKTQEQAETNYYHIPLAGADASLVPVGDFWLDYARSDPKKPFFSPLLAEASHTFAEMMLALAVTDLPFERAPHELKTDGKRLTIQARGPLVVYHKQTRALDAPGESGGILLTESFFRQDDRYAQVDGQKVDKPVTGEFVAHVVYGCQVVATNPTSSPQRLNVLLQIPDGAIPVLGSAATRSVRVVLTPFHVWTGEYFFYFPKPGEFAHYPVHAWSGEKLVGSAQPRALNVVATPSQVDTASWDHVSQNGTEDQVIEFLRHRSLAGVDLDRMAWRLKSKAFFERAVQMLRERHVYAPLTWSYALLHNVPAAAREFLRTQDNFVISCGSALTSPLLTIDPFERRIYEHLEYWPFVNARAHQLGRERAILNDKLRIQYSRFLDKVCHRPSPTQEDLLEAAYYLLLQDRVEEASEIVARGGPDGEVARLQRDYMTAYLGFTRNDLASSRGVAEKNAAHPVERWRRLFREVLSQLDEIEGKTAPPKDADSPANQQALAATEPSLDVEIEGSEAVVRHRNLTECRVSYYLMDVELLFSRTPFLGESSGQFSLVRPNAVEVVKLDPSKDAARVPIPERFLARNVLVEVSAAGLRKAKTRFAGTLDAQIAEAFAQARVTNAASSRPSSGVYVKVYARRGDGSVKFYKDGYTDLRGRFDYGTLSTSDLDDVQRFALLFVSDDGAAVLREAAPPKR